MTIVQAAAKSCTDQSGLSCALSSNDCNNYWSTLVTADDLDPTTAGLYNAMLLCMAESLTASGYNCSPGAMFIAAGGTSGPSPIVNTALTSPCATEICAYTCALYSITYDTDLYDTCGC